jgi:hypothetical protein
MNIKTFIATMNVTLSYENDSDLVEDEAKDREVSFFIKGVFYAGSLVDRLDLDIPFEVIRLQDVVSNTTATPTPSPSTLEPSESPVFGILQPTVATPFPSLS